MNRVHVFSSKKYSSTQHRKSEGSKLSCLYFLIRERYDSNIIKLHWIIVLLQNNKLEGVNFSKVEYTYCICTHVFVNVYSNWSSWENEMKYLVDDTCVE